MIILQIITLGLSLLASGVFIWAILTAIKTESKFHRIDKIEEDLEDYRETLEILLEIENERTKCEVLNRMIVETKKEIKQLEKEYEELINNL